MRGFKMFAAILIASAALVGCGQRVDIGPAQAGKISTKDGYKEGTISTSKFRLDPCMAYCDKLVTLNVGDNAFSEPMELVMPKDKLKMAFVLQMTLSMNPKKIDEVFSRVAPQDIADADHLARIDVQRVYSTYAQQIIRTEAREHLSQYSIAEVLSNLDRVNAELSQKLTESISRQTPFQPRYIGLAQVTYPEVIVKAQEASAARREQIERENAELEVSKVQMERELQEQRLKREIEVTKAESEAKVSAIQAKAMTPEYTRYRELEIMELLAKSPNKVFVPVGSLNSIAVQSQIGR